MADHQQHCIVALVDDDARVRESLEHLLYSAGIETRSFRSAEEALQPGELDSVCCLITDVRMPIMSGIELQAHLRSRGYKVPFIFITAVPEESIRRQAFNDGTICFLHKPLNNQALIACLEKVIQPRSNGEG